MKCRNEIVRCGPLILILASVSISVSAEDAIPTSGYTYKEDWAVVSAPPPPGPYQTVNIDPRVPGAGAVPPLSMDAPGIAEQDIPAEALATPPAAGMPSQAPLTEGPAASHPGTQKSGAHQRAPAQPGYSYSAQPRYRAQPYQKPPAGAYKGGYRNQPPYGYYGSPNYQPQGQQTQQVPPPPVYDAMIKNQQPYGYPAR